MNQDSDDFENKSGNTKQNDWDCTLHLPLWIPSTEKTAIEQYINRWTDQLEASGADITSLTSSLKKPLRPLWVSQKTVIWLNEVPDPDTLDFTPIILVSSSSADGLCQRRQNSEFSWNYISGAGDDEESWARGLSPNLFWNNVYDIINVGPDSCNQKVADIVEKDRVYRAHRGLDAPQVLVKGSNFSGGSYLGDPVVENGENTVSGGCDVFWLGSSKVAVCASRHAQTAPRVDCILNCDTELVSANLVNPEAYLHLPIQNSKFDRFSLLRNLPSAVKFAGFNLRSGKSLLVCCNTGEDISICICLAILSSLFTVEGISERRMKS
jgi:tRNA A64-2'-O-ribosylphosphate transferase